jgi:hypothetical protein
MNAKFVIGHIVVLHDTKTLKSIFYEDINLMMMSQKVNKMPNFWVKLIIRMSTPNGSIYVLVLE